MKRMVSLLSVLVLMAVVMTVMAANVWAQPPWGGEDNSGCKAGQSNAYQAIGAGWASIQPDEFEQGDESPAPYRDNPGKGTGPDQGFDKSKANTRDSTNCR